MGEAVAKEPSMEEILSSIRKIITDDGGSDASAKAEAASEKKPDIKIATTTKPNKSNAAPSAAEIKNALAAIQENVKQENVKEAAAVSEEVVVEEEKPWIATSVETGGVSSITSGQADSISFVDTPSDDGDASSETAEVEFVKEVEKVEVAPKIVTAETVSEVPAPSSKSSTQDNKAMASNEAASNEASSFKSALMSSNTDKIVNEAFEELRRVTMDNIDEKTESLLRPMLSDWLDNNLPTLVERLVREEIERVSGSR